MSELQLFDALPAHIEDALRASIRRFGVLSPVTRDQHGRIIDGHHRVRIAGEEGIAIADDVIIHVDDDDEAREIARTLNSDRRHLTEEQRRAVVADLRSEGHSVRAIAGALGVGKSTVARDLAGVPGGTPEQPERVKGTDGKSYAATRPAPEPAPEPDLLAGDDWAEPAPVPEPSVRQTPIVEPSTNAEADEETAATYARLDAELDAEMEGTDTRFRRNFTGAMAKADDLWQFDIDRIADLYAATYDTDIRPWTQEMTRWCERVERACKQRRSGLRIVEGG